MGMTENNDVSLVINIGFQYEHHLCRIQTVILRRHDFGYLTIAHLLDQILGIL